MSEVNTIKIKKPRVKKEPPQPVNLCGRGFQKRTSILPVKGSDGEKVFFRAKSTQPKDVDKAIWGTPGLGLGIGCMVRVYEVDAQGNQNYLYTLYPTYRVTIGPRGTNVKTMAKPRVSYDESLTVEQTLPPGL